VNSEGGSALHAAAANGDKLIIEALIHRMADVNQLDQYAFLPHVLMC
jgi:ankyrin repeat protein